MFSSKKKKLEKEAQKLKLIKETQDHWENFQNVHNKVYSEQLSLKSLLNVKEEMKLREMPLMRSKHCKLKETPDMMKILNSNIIIIKEDALYFRFINGSARKKNKNVKDKIPQSRWVYALMVSSSLVLISTSGSC